MESTLLSIRKYPFASSEQCYLFCQMMTGSIKVLLITLKRMCLFGKPNNGLQNKRYIWSFYETDGLGHYKQVSL